MDLGVGGVYRLRERQNHKKSSAEAGSIIVVRRRLCSSTNDAVAAAAAVRVSGAYLARPNVERGSEKRGIRKEEEEEIGDQFLSELSFVNGFSRTPGMLGGQKRRPRGPDDV